MIQLQRSRVAGETRPRLSVISVLLLLISVPILASGEVAWADEAHGESRVDFGNHHPTLSNATRTTIKGERTADGRCAFRPPPLALAPRAERAIERRQVALDPTTCTSVFEVGTPSGANRESEPADGTSGAASTKARAPVAPSAGGQTSTAAAATTGSGYYTVWWEDLVNIDTTRVTSDITWSWDGTCVVGTVYGMHNWWWRSETGWSLDWYGYGIRFPNGCVEAEVWTDGTFKNSAFPLCVPGTVKTVYDDVRAEGYSTGALVGSLGTTYTAESGTPPWCPNLHWHDEVARTR